MILPNVRDPTESDHQLLALWAASCAEHVHAAAGRRECQWQRDLLPETIRELVVDDQRMRNDSCWSVFDC